MQFFTPSSNPFATVLCVPVGLTGPTLTGLRLCLEAGTTKRRPCADVLRIYKKETVRDRDDPEPEIPNSFEVISREELDLERVQCRAKTLACVGGHIGAYNGVFVTALILVH